MAILAAWILAGTASADPAAAPVDPYAGLVDKSGVVAPAPTIPAPAGPPPSEPDAADLSARSRHDVSEMPGCFAMTGTAVDHWDAGIFGEGDRTWALAGKLVDGRWEEFTHTWVSGKAVDEADDRRSLFGRFPKREGDDEARAKLIEALEGEVSAEYVEPDSGGWRLTRTLKGGETDRNLLVVRFNGALRAWNWTVTIADPVVVKGERGKAKIVFLDTQLTAAEDGAPAYERFVARFTRWPFGVDVNAQTTWTHTPCGG